MCENDVDMMPTRLLRPRRRASGYAGRARPYAIINIFCKNGAVICGIVATLTHMQVCCDYIIYVFGREGPPKGEVASGGPYVTCVWCQPVREVKRKQLIVG